MKMKNLWKMAASLILAPAIMFSCQKKDDLKTNTLEVSPSETVQFKASGNTPVVLTVTTDADSWAFTAPEWIEATKDGNTLSVNAKDNTSSTSRSGRISFSAGNAEKVNVPVLQDASNGGSGSTAEASIIDSDTNENDMTLTLSSTEPVHTSHIKLVLAQPAAQDMEVKLALDMEYAAEYSFTHDNIACENLPEDKVTFGNNAVLKISAGQTESEPVEISIDATDCMNQTNYLVSVVVSESEGLDFGVDSKRINYLVSKKLPKQIKNVVYLEVNNTNPLNLLEYKLEDGSPFFDVVILFAANINYDGEQDIVYLHNNPNVQALLDETEVYLQPLRKAGMEVQLGLLPNHTPAGLVNLSEVGAEMFATDVANACNQYKLDGASLDEEYREGWSDSYLFNPKAGATYLCYQLKKQFKDICGREDMKISVFDYGYDWNSYTDTEGTLHTPSQYVDFYVANYGGSTSPKEGFTMANCSGMSIECNLGIGSVNEESARRMKEQGYGWLMWFAFHPQNGGGLSNNSYRADPMIKAVARGFYDQELQEPTGYYTKLGEGSYDPTRYDRTW